MNHRPFRRASSPFRLPLLVGPLAALLTAAWAGAAALAAAESPEAVTQPEKPDSPRQTGPARVSNFADAANWIQNVIGTGVRVTPSGNGFEVAYSPEAGSADVVGGEYISTFALRGDFTLDVDYALDEWPEANGVRVAVTIRPFVSSIRSSTPEWGETYSFAAGSAVTVATEDRRGSLRLVRRGGTLLAYHRGSPGAAWVLTGSRSDDPAFREDLQVHVGSWTGNGFGGRTVRIRLSNFAMSADTVLPGPFGIPPWSLPSAFGFHPPAPPTPKGEQLSVRAPSGWALYTFGKDGTYKEVKRDELSSGILEEDLNLDLAAASQSYLSLITQFDTQRPLVANAIFRLGECYRRMGRLDDARAQYRRILREFSDQTVLVGLCRRYEPTLTSATSPAEPGPSSTPPSGTEIAALEWQLLQARNEALKAATAVAEGKATLAERLRGFWSGTTTKQDIERAQAALELAQGQAALWSGEVTHLEARLKALQQQRETIARRNLEQADAYLKRISEAQSLHSIPDSEYDEAKRAREKAAADYSAAASDSATPP